MHNKMQNSGIDIRNTIVVKPRRVDLDLMRIIACFLVIYNHTDGYHLFLNTESSIVIWISMIPAMITRINVPIFFMISGALLLSDRQESYAEIIKKRCLRNVIVLFLFTSLLYIVQLYKTGDAFSVERLFRYLLGGTDEIGGLPYWYLYCYLGFLLLLPILRKITSKITKQDFILLIVIHFLFCTFLPIINLVLSANSIQGLVISKYFTDTLHIGIAKALFYPLIGNYLDKQISIEQITKKKLIVLIIMSIIGILLSCICTYYEGTHGDMKFTQNYVELFDYVSAICAFISIKYFCFKHSCFESHPQLVKAVTMIGSYTFGIYLLFPVLKRCFYSKLITPMHQYIPTIAASILWCFAIMFVGSLITCVVRKVPGIKKIL